MNPWETLGIAPTDDQRAIRAAYAAKLKAIDVESDPVAFLRLREALDALRAGADRATIRLAEPAAPEPSCPGTSSSAHTPKPEAAAQVHADALTALLYPGGDARPWLDADEERQALEHWRAITQDPRIADIGHFGMVERWASDLIGNALPRSAPLVAPAISFFRWTDADGHLGQSHALAEINRHHRLHGFLSDIREPANRYHAAWTELSLSAPQGVRRGSVDPRLVYDVLAVIRQAGPAIEHTLDPRRVAMWDAHVGGLDRTGEQAEAEARRHGQYSNVARWIFYALFLGPGLLGLLGAMIGGLARNPQ